MANLPEKNITTVDKITSIPSNTNLYINANGEFRQATIDDVLKASPVIADSIANQYKNASGSPILLTDSAKGVAIEFNAKGRSTQAQYSGKNKFNVANIPNLTGLTNNNGVLTITNNYTILVTIALSKLADLVVGETYTLSFKTTSTNNFIYVRGAQYQWTNGTSLTITQAMLDGGINLYGVESGTVTISDIQIEKGSTATTYEPYVGGTISPNPSYPQPIESVGDMGYFDGELLNGVYNTSNGIYGSNANYLCNKNPIPCNASDDVTFTYHTDTQYNLMILFYDEDMNYLSYKNTTTSDTLTATAPTNASYCNFNIGYGSALSVANASPITVTINDKYALIVDSKGKNFLENITTGSTSNGITVTVNDNKSINIKGTANVQSSASKWVEVCNKTLPRGSYILSGSPSGASSNSYSFYINIGSASGVIISSDYTFTLTEDTTVKVQLRIPLLGQTIDTTFYPMIRPLGTDATYEPYKKSRKYIPISAPLRGIGEVTDVASLSKCKVERKYTKVVFDGSEDEQWSTFGQESRPIGTYCYFVVNTNKKLKYNTSTCTHFNYKPSAWAYGTIGTFSDHSINNFYFVTDKSTLSEWTAWLQANPITVQYELAEPTTESIEPIEIVTYDNVTHISASDNAEMEVEYPTSKVAGIASIGWSKGRRAEYDLEQLKVQMLALQTTIVSTV